MSIDYCPECEVIVEGSTTGCICCGKDHLCPYCNEPVTGLPEDRDDIVVRDVGDKVVIIADSEEFADAIEIMVKNEQI